MRVMKQEWKNGSTDCISTIYSSLFVIPYNQVGIHPDSKFFSAVTAVDDTMILSLFPCGRKNIYGKP